MSEERNSSFVPERVLERVTDAVLSLDTDWRFTYLNERATEIFGKKEDDLIGKNIWEMFPEAKNTRFYDEYRDAMRTGEPRTIEEYFEPWDKWYKESIYPSSDGLTVIFQDVTEKKTRQEEIKRREEWYRHIIAHSSDVIMVVNSDLEISYCSPTIKEITGHTPDEITGTNPFQYAHPDDITEAAQKLEEVLKKPNEDVNVEFRVLNKDGGHTWIEVRGRNNLDNDVIDGILIDIRDITKNKEKEKQLKEINERFQAYVENASDIITVVDENGNLKYQSPSVEKVLGYPQNKLLGQSIFKYMHPDDEEEVAQAFLEAIETNQEKTDKVEYRFKHNDGHWVWLETIGSSNKSEELDGYVANSRDITERKKQEHELQQERDRLEEFTGIVSHDLRNPLGVAMGHVELAIEEDPENERLETIYNSLKRMNTLIKELLVLAKKGDETLQKEEIKINEIAKQAWENVDTHTAEIDIKTNKGTQADPSRLQQIFENLIRNTIEHASTDAEIEIGDTPNGFYYEDNGPGIPAGIKDRLLKPNQTQKPNGTGLGLSIIKQITESHGWEIEIKTGDKGGARFEITLEPE